MRYETKANLDLGPMAPESRQAAVLQAFDQMNPGDSMLLDSPRPPLAILHTLQSDRKGLFEWAPVDHPPCWRVEIARRAAPEHGWLVHDTLAWEHARLDDEQQATLAAIAGGDLPEARHHFVLFERRLNRHIHFEEEILFPAFESKTGQREGPTSGMRAEHRQIRMMLERAGRSLYASVPEAEKACRRLLEVLETHDFQEEATFYGTLDRLLTEAESATLVERIHEFA
jgi:regulator of cell morphogenesis and NO signaling